MKMPFYIVFCRRRWILKDAETNCIIEEDEREKKNLEASDSSLSRK